MIKEAAVSLAFSFPLGSAAGPTRLLGEVAERAFDEHPELNFEGRPSGYEDPDSALRHLQFRCSLSGVSLEWCQRVAMNVSPEPAAASLVEDTTALEERIVQILQRPFILAPR
jgi:hypothetical protein